MKIMLVCSAGMSTSLLVKRMKKVVDENGIDLEIFAVPEASANQYYNDIDILLLGPQIKYLEERFKKESDDRFPVSIIDIQKYGMLDGTGVLKDALKTIKAFKNSN